MSIKSTFYVILILLIQFSYQFFLHSHHKLQKYHRNTITRQNPIELQSYAHQIDIRGAFSEPQTFSGQEIQRKSPQTSFTAICDIKIDDFYDATMLEKAFCAANNELLVFLDPGNQFYCIGYLESEKRSKKNGILALKFDRSYQVQYSPGRIKTEKSSNLGMKFYMDQRSLNMILIKGGYEGLPEITEIEFEGKKICKGGKTKIKIQKQASFDSSEEENIPFKPIPRQEFDEEPKNRPIVMPSTPHVGQKPEFSCGIRPVSHSKLISNAQFAKSGDWPFHATIFHTSIRTFQYKCGGTIISTHLILTAAHCVLENGNQIISERVKVHLGRGNLGNFDVNSKEYDVYEILCHEEFSGDTARHDIALLKLGTSIQFTRFIQPACLPSTDFEIIGGDGIVIGFGRTENGQISSVLKQAHMKVPSTMDCLESNRDFYGAFLYEGNFCAGHLEYKSVACTGDSGGGLYFNVNGVWIVRGIVSIAIREDDEDDGCSPNNYVLYTDIYKHMTWINGKM